jgi:hypothetical protein
MVVNESLRVLRCRLVIVALENVAFQKVAVEPDRIRAVYLGPRRLPKPNRGPSGSTGSGVASSASTMPVKVAWRG